MRRIDFYIFKQLMSAFGLTSLVLVLIYWTNSAVLLFDQVIADGQTVFVFLELASMLLPNIIFLNTPIALFIAGVFVTNRMIRDSEFNVLLSSHNSNLRLSRAYWVFALLIFLGMLVLAHLLVPLSNERLSLRKLQIAENYTSRLISDGVFQNPSEGITLYIESISPEGELINVFLNDNTSEDISLTYTAGIAFLVRSDQGPKMALIEGMIQRYDHKTQNLAITKFDNYVINISELIATNVAPDNIITHITTPDLLQNIQKARPFSEDYIFFEINMRVVWSLLSFVAMLLGYSMLASTTYSRFGLWKNILYAVTVMIFIKLLEGYISDLTLKDGRYWPFMYLPFTLGILLTIAILIKADMPFRKQQEGAL